MRGQKKREVFIDWSKPNSTCLAFFGRKSPKVLEIEEELKDDIGPCTSTNE
jgi:hypothetical protein